MPLFFDKEIITIILDNLISNAIKYTEQGKITLSCIPPHETGSLIRRLKSGVRDTESLRKPCLMFSTVTIRKAASIRHPAQVSDWL